MCFSKASLFVLIVTVKEAMRYDQHLTQAPTPICLVPSCIQGIPDQFDWNPQKRMLTDLDKGEFMQYLWRSSCNPRCNTPGSRASLALLAVKVCFPSEASAIQQAQLQIHVVVQILKKYQLCILYNSYPKHHFIFAGKFSFPSLLLFFFCR